MFVEIVILNADVRNKPYDAVVTVPIPEVQAFAKQIFSVELSFKPEIEVPIPITIFID